MRDVTSDLQMEVEGLLAQPRGLLLIAREIVKRGDAAVACAVTLLDRRAQAPGADPFRNQELKVLIHALRHDRSQAEAEMKVLLGEGWKGVKGAGRLVITLAGRSEELDAAAHLLEVARAAAPKAYALERASALVEKRQAHKGAEERRREKRAERDDGEPGPEAQVLSAAKKAARALDWAEASELLDAADDSSRIREQKALAAVYESHQDPAGLTPRRLPSVDIRYINLDRDDARRTRIEGEFADCGLQLQRSAAVMGAALPAIVRERIITDAGFMDHGVLAVFLSHVRTWELVLASQRPCLILEDDARPIFRLGRVLEQLADEVEDLCFLNDRICNRLKSVHPEPTTFVTEPLRTLAARFAGNPAAPGGDGYLLTPSGAAKLLAYVSEDGCLGHVDVQLLSYCLKQEDYPPELATGGQYGRLARYWQKHKSERRLNAALVYPPLTAHADEGKSSRTAV